jgi:pimeloyl-ACP methyl ester carboxylesterase
VTPTPAPPQPVSDPPLTALELPHGVLTYSDEGPRDAPALLAVHGIPGSVRDFRHLAPLLTERLRFIRIDLPGFGGSAPLHPDVDTFGSRAQVVVDLADALGLPQFSILGHSMGGGTALVLAATHPERVRLLVLVASVALSCHRGLGLPPTAFALMGRLVQTPGLGDLLLPLMRAQYKRRRLPGAETMGRLEMARQLRAIAAADFALLRRSVDAALPRTLVAYARDDHMIETHVSEELARALSHARLLAFDSGGHNLQKTRAGELARALRQELGVADA